ncbi:unnamed protein product [Linum tenue]|uniref:Rab3 GTPase-activating protein catalytic subunit n=1 Tax=Linum tenue TaxID=586396 RepID=A0AAV0IQU9_9ROSI|nr:unnamed protein product [Linum tenue]
MASTSKVDPPGEDGVEEEELERFDDFTIASSWERFISEIEAVCRQWIADGPKNLLEKGAMQLESSQNLYRVKFELKYALKTYCMEYFFETDSAVKIPEWTSPVHDLQLCFGVKEFLVIAPQSASGVVLDAPEASKLLSAVAIALTNCCSLLAAFVPVHDPSRKAFIGIQNMGTIFTRRFEADRIGSQVPVKLMHLEGLYELFVSKFAYSSLDLVSYHFKVHLRMKSTYRTFSHDDDEDDDYASAQGLNPQDIDGMGSPRVDSHSRAQWDDDCPWSEWYSAEDPIKGVELIATWPERMVENSPEMEELENTSPHEAEKWVMLPVISPNLDSSGGNRIGFASQLLLLIHALDISFNAQFVEDFVSAENIAPNKLTSSMVVPPPTVLDRVLKDLFQGSQVQGFAKEEYKYSRGIKGAPVGSLFSQFSLHSLWVGNCNIRAIAVLWVEFTREVRWCWEESQPLPKVQVNGSIDLATCLVNQKLQMLAICIERKCELNEDFQDCLGSNDQPHAQKKVAEDGPLRNDTASTKVSSSESDRIHDSSPTAHGSSQKYEKIASSSIMKQHLKSSDNLRRGSAGVVGSMKLLKTYQSMHAPYTQDPPLMTEDMHEERLQAVEAFGDSFNFSAQLERDVLASDMSAFKAANPDAVFEDFIRWHSPGDWINDETEDKAAASVGSSSLKEDWPPRGQLSKRMSEQGNLWRKIWNDAPALPAYEQKPLLDPNREGEKILHYLETLQPHQLLEQMVCTAFKAAADTLNMTNHGGLKQMTTKMEQLYNTMSSTLKPLQTNRLSKGSDTIEDLKRLSTVFEHVEKLLTLAASLHRKFSNAPRLSESIFADYYEFYLPKMGTGAGSGDIKHQEFDKKQQVKMKEREVVSNLFKPPTANQKWRKVISMGNLLNGHEPTMREIVFTTHEAITPAATSRLELGMETYRMYIAGTSNDLRVALSVTSCD